MDLPLISSLLAWGWWGTGKPYPYSPPSVALLCLLRYGQLLEQSRHSWLNTTTLITGCTNTAGLLLVGNFQVCYRATWSWLGGKCSTYP